MRNFSQKVFSGFAGKIGVMSFVLLFLTFAFASQAKADIVISEIYGGGGNTGAVLQNDFVELFNNGTTAVDVSAYSIQYAGATGTTTFAVIPLSTATDTLIEPGTFFLIQLGTSGAVGTVNPTANVVAGNNISATAGKVALVNNTTQLTGACPIPNAAILDFVGYGTTANCFETARAPAGSNTQSIQRNAFGTDSNNNSADFTATTAGPTPTAGGFGDLTITQTAPATVTENTNFNYTLTLTNTGSNANLTGVSVNFTLPTGVTFVSATGGNCATMAVVGGVVQFRGCTIAANQTTLTVTVTAPANATQTTITSTGTNVTIDPLLTITESNEANNTAPADATTNVTAAPTAATVNVGGRVTSAKGRGIFRAVVSMTDGSGNKFVAYTNSLGYYRFEEVEAGQTLIFNVRAKGYNFTQPTQLVSLNEEATTINFKAYESRVF